jgi:hypothetical protein
MTQNDRPSVLLVQKLVHEQVHRCAERPEGKVADVFSKDKQSESRTEGEMREGRLNNSRCSALLSMT